MKEKTLQIITAIVINFILAWPLSYALDISNVNHHVSDNTALITWETDNTATSSVYYGKTESTELSKNNQTKVTYHSVDLTNLDFNTLYYYKVRSCDGADCNISNIYSFTTENLPSPEKVTGLKNKTVTRNSISLEWDASSSSYLSHYLVYRDNVIVGNVTTTSYTDEELDALTAYDYEVSVVDTAGNVGDKSDTLTVTTLEPDLTGPVINETIVAALTSDSATIIWKTDEDSNSTVYYGESSLLGEEEGSSTYTKSHSIAISQLENGTTYFYKVESCDVDGNCALSELAEFVPGTDTTPPTIEVTLPKYYNDYKIRITGKTKASTDVKFYVNNVYKGILGKTSTKDGNIDIELGGLVEGNNTIKIVAIDSYNLQAEKTFSIIVDSKPPKYTISEIPALSPERNLVINGTVDEECTITFYSHIVSEGLSVPERVSNFKSDYEKLTPNSVTLVWDKMDDIDHYQIYRKDIGLIGVPVKSPFVDNYANTSTTYTYEIAAVYKDCGVGQKSSISVKTLDGGNVGVRKPTVLTSRCGGITPKGSIKASGAFTYSLGLNTGLNEVVVNISDIAGNSVLIKKNTIHDSNKPIITYTNLDKLSPSYTQEIEIEGKVSEHAKVYVYIDDEEQASYTAETDGEGNFKVDVSLRRTVSVDTEVQSSSVNVRAESSSIWKNKIKIIAIDDVGLESEPVTADIDYQLCGQGGDWNIEIGEVTPDIIIPRLLLQGVSRIGFNVNYKWQGPGESKDVTITEKPKISLRALNKLDQEKFDEEFFSHVWNKHSNDYRSGYFLIDLKTPYVENNLTTLEQENNMSNHNLGDCIVPGLGCIKLPLILEINYAYKDPYGTSLTGTKSEDYSSVARRDEREGTVYLTQKQCFYVEVAIDRRLPIDKLPKGFLEAMVKGLNATITAIDAVLEPLDTVKKFVFIGCMGGFVAWIFYKAKEWGACNKLKGIFQGFDANTCDPRTEGKSGEDLEEAQGCASCLKAKGETIKAWEIIGWVCDRIMCPAAPTIQKYVRDVQSEEKRQAKIDIDINKRQKSHCQDEDIEEIKFTTKKNDDVDKVYRDTDEYLLEVRNVKKEVPGYKDATYCESEYIRMYDSVSFINELKESYCVTEKESTDEINCGGVAKVPRLLRGVCEKSEETGPRLISSEGNTYLISDENKEGKKVKAAFEVTKKEDISLTKVDNNYFEVDQANVLIQKFATQLNLPEGYSGSKVYLRKEKQIMDENDCYIVNGARVSDAKTKPDKTYISYDDISDVDRRKDLGIDQAKNPVWNIANFKPQFCGIEKSVIEMGSTLDKDKIKIDKTEYEKKDGKWCPLNVAEKKKTCYDDKKFSEEILKSNAVLERGADTYNYDSKNNGFVKKDTKSSKTKCVKIPRAIWEEVCSDAAKDYVIDPTSGIVSAFQSVCLTAMSAYLTQYKAMLEMIKNCFEQLLYTGEGSSGVCKQFLSIYLCDLIYEGIRCITEKSGKGYGNQPKKGVFGFINYIKDGGSQIQNSIRGRYGSSSIYQTMFVEKKLIHAACAWAFTGDFDLDIDAMLDSELTAPIKTMCYITGDRRFGYADPQTGRATFLYNLGVFVVGGGSAGSITSGRGSTVSTSTDHTSLIKPVKYRVELVCSNTNDCQSDISSSGSCDCLTYSGEQSSRGTQGEIKWVVPVGDGTLEQGETLNEDVYYDKAINLPYRFDRARILVIYVDNNGVEHTDELCAETYLTGTGSDPPAMCKFDITQGFICEFEWGEFVTAYFDDVRFKTLRQQETITQDLYVGYVIELEGDIIKEGSSEKMEEQKIYLQYRLYTGGRELTGSLKKEMTKRTTDLEVDLKAGDYAFPGFIITDSGSAYDPDTNKVNPFIGSTSPALNYDASKGSKFSIGSDTTIDKLGMFSEIKITFSKDKDGSYYTVTGDCDLKSQTKIKYSGSVSIKCRTANQIILTISGTPKEGEVVKITNDRIGTESEDRRHVYLELSLHAADEYGQIDTTPLTYDKETQKKTFDFYVTKKARTAVKADEEFVEVSSKTDSCSEGCKLRKETAERFERAVEVAKKGGITLKANSAYRTPEKQKGLWDKYNHDSSRVCGPKGDSFDHCPHVTGNAVDVYVEGLNCGEYETYQSHKFTSENLECHKKILEIMAGQDFVRYGKEDNTQGEWWHFEYGTTRWKSAKENGVNSII